MGLWRNEITQIGLLIAFIFFIIFPFILLVWQIKLKGWERIWQRGSFSQAIFLALLAISIVPITFISILFISQSTNALTEQMETNLQQLAETKASEINLKLQNVTNMTEVASQQAALVLTQELSDEYIQQQLDRYQPDHRNIVGLDVYYNQPGNAEKPGTNLSNVYWNNEGMPINDTIARQIVQTEQLDPIFESIKSVNPTTQWIYVTTSEGMMRIYPWRDNDKYPDGWDPRAAPFYTVAAPSNNPTLEPQWTPPYVNFAGTEGTITVSTPILDEEAKVLGIMSHDMTIHSLTEVALNIQVLDGSGYGFLINSEGDVIAHPDFQRDKTSGDTLEDANLLDTGPPEFRNLVQQMIRGEEGIGYFSDSTLGEQILVHAPIPAIGWRLGIVVPRTDVVQPATTMRGRALIVLALSAIAAVAMAIFIAQLLQKPLAKLLKGVRNVSEDRQAEKINVASFRELNHLAQAFNDMSVKVWEREEQLKMQVAKLRIKIDTTRKEKALESLVETDYFKHLEINAERLRRNLKNSDKDL